MHVTADGYNAATVHAVVVVESDKCGGVITSVLDVALTPL